MHLLTVKMACPLPLPTKARPNSFLHMTFGRPARSSAVLSNDLRERLCVARDLLCDGEGSAPTLAEIARRCGVPVTKLIRRFTTVFGETPHQYRSRVRLDRALRLLHDPSQTVTRVCMDLGYSSLGSFSWTFSRRFGESPSAFRVRALAEPAAPTAPAWRYGDGCFALMIAAYGAAAGAAQFSRSTADASPVD